MPGVATFTAPILRNFTALVNNGSAIITSELLLILRGGDGLCAG
jgi:hypothetical protein